MDHVNVNLLKQISEAQMIVDAYRDEKDGQRNTVVSVINLHSSSQVYFHNLFRKVQTILFYC